MSGTSGGEDYAQPTATTTPGATTYTLQAPNSVGPVFFVVRARDTAGVSDNNTVQRGAVDSCTGGAQ
jgi:hypothetical protein